MKKIYLILLVIFLCSCAHWNHITTKAMEPTFTVGDFVVIDANFYRNREIKRFDIVAYIDPTHRFIQVSRVVGLPNEIIEFHRGKVYINGNILEDKYGPTHSFKRAPVYLAENDYFLLGDNRENSADSRFFGPLLRKNIIGKVTDIKKTN